MTGRRNPTPLELVMSLAVLAIVLTGVIAYHLGRRDEMYDWWARVERGEFRLVLPGERSR